jgi:hypothetical protein
VARESSHVEAWESSHVVAWGSSHVEAWESSHVVAWESSHVVARGSSHVEARESVAVHLLSSLCEAVLHGFSVALVSFDVKAKISRKSKTAIVKRFKQEPYLKREGCEVKDKKVILFKRVSKDWKTMEGTKDETCWKPGTSLDHPCWSPKEEECGKGKFHACSRPYFCDEFRSERNDRYVAIEISVKDLYEWPKPSYPHKIAFRKGTVLHECDSFGVEK